MFSVVMEKQQWVQCTLLSSYKYFILLLKIISIPYYDSVSVLLPTLSGTQIKNFLRVISAASLALRIFSIIS